MKKIDDTTKIEKSVSQIEFMIYFISDYTL